MSYKILLGIISMILTLMDIYGQSYIPIPDSAAVYVNAANFWQIPDNGYDYICAPGTDTTIDSKTYKIFQKCQSHSYLGAIRNSEGIVYIVPPDSTSEYVLFDFSLNINDTLKNFILDYEPDGSSIIGDAFVSSVALVNLGGVLRKQVDLTYLSGLQGHVSWFEGIGDTVKFLYENFPLYKERWLNCISVSDTVYYLNEINGDINHCDFIITSNQGSVAQVDQVLIYPNPSGDGMFYVQSEEFQFESITNTVGETLQIPKSAYAQNGLKLNLSMYPQGIYYIHLVNLDKEYKVVKVLKQ